MSNEKKSYSSSRLSLEKHKSKKQNHRELEKSISEEIGVEELRISLEEGDYGGNTKMQRCKSTPSLTETGSSKVPRKRGFIMNVGKRITQFFGGLFFFFFFFFFFQLVFELIEFESFCFRKRY